jgi:hypothetical protein
MISLRCIIIVGILLSLYSANADTAYTVTSGSTFSINASQTAGSNAFVKKPQVYVRAGGSRYKCRVLDRSSSFPRDTLACAWYNNAPPGTYTLVIKRKGKGAVPETISTAFAVKNPMATSVLPVTGIGGDEIVLQGWFFGSKPKVWLQTVAGVKMKCRLQTPMKYSDWRGRAGKSCMEPGSGVSYVSIMLHKKLRQETAGMLYIQNRTGIGSIPFNLTNRYSLTVNICPPGTGTTIPEAGPPHTVGSEAPVHVLASPAPECRFVQWLPAPGSVFDNRYSADTLLMITGNTAVTALFTNTPPKPWTVLAYWCADNNLEKDYIYAFKQMITNNVGSCSNLNFVMQFDRVPGYSTNYGDWTICHRFYVTPGMEPTEGNAVQYWQDGRGGGREVSMDDPATLRDFINWGVGHFPAQNYALFIGDHGLSWQGCCLDETSDEDYMFLTEVRQALENPGQDMDMIIFDACLMGTIDVAYELRNAGAEIMVATEQPGNAWPYWDVIGAYMEHPEWTAAQFGTALTDYYFEYNKGDPTIRGATMASLDMNAIVPLSDSFAELIALATNEAPYLALQQKAQEITNRVDQFVLHYRNNEFWSTNAYGISLYYPLNNETPELFMSYYIGKQASFARGTFWRDFLKIIHDPMTSHIELDAGFFHARESMTNILFNASYNIDLREYMRRFIEGEE